MIEFVLFVWLVVPGQVSDPVEIGTYYQLARCEEARDAIEIERPDASFVAICVARDK